MQTQLEYRVDDRFLQSICGPPIAHKLGSLYEYRLQHQRLLHGNISQVLLGHLVELENVILTPHIGSYAKEIRIKMETEAAENLLRGINEK